MEGEWGISLKICHVYTDSFFEKTNDLLSTSVDGGCGGHKICNFFVDVINIWPLNGLKLKTNSVIRDISFLFNTRPDTF